MRFSVVFFSRVIDDVDITSLRNLMGRCACELIVVNPHRPQSVTKLLVNLFPGRVKILEDDGSSPQNAINIGVKSASGEFIILLCSGDSLFLDALCAFESALFDLSSVDVIETPPITHNVQATLIRHTPPHLEETSFSYPSLVERLLHAPASHSVIVRRSLYIEVGYYDLSCSHVADIKFLLAVGSTTDKVLKTNVPLYSYCVSDPDSITFSSRGRKASRIAELNLLFWLENRLLLERVCGNVDVVTYFLRNFIRALLSGFFRVCINALGALRGRDFLVMCIAPFRYIVIRRSRVYYKIP